MLASVENERHTEFACQLVDGEIAEPADGREEVRPRAERFRRMAFDAPRREIFTKSTREGR